MTVALDACPGQLGSAPLAAGHGLAVVARDRQRSQVVRAQARAPMKLLQPRAEPSVARVVCTSFGGGLVAGDDLLLRMRVETGATALLSTQASTKVFRSDGDVARQRVEATVTAGGLLAVVTDPVTCFAAARFEQSQSYALEDEASLLLLDVLTSGRWGCGERWAFASYRSTIDVAVGGVPLLRDCVVLDPADGALASPYRCGRFECLLTLVLLGPKLAEIAQAALETIHGQAVDRRAAMITAASPITGGALVRAAGPSAEACMALVRSLCRGTAEVIGTDPWARRW